MKRVKSLKVSSTSSFGNLFSKEFLFVSATLCAAILLRFYACSVTGGIIHWDEQYQYIEPAFGMSFGFWFKAWEFQEGARSFFFPLINFAIFKIGLLAGISDVRILVLLLRVLATTLSILIVPVTYLLAKNIYGKRVGLYTLVMVAFSATLIIWAPRVLSELPSTLFILLSAYFLFISTKKENAPLITVVFSGVFLGVAFMFRFLSIVILLPFLCYLIFGRKYKRTGMLLAGLTVVLIVQGILDLIFYGHFFCSPLNYFDFNVIKLKSSLMWISPACFYLEQYVYILTPIAVACLFISIYSILRRRNSHGWLIFSVFLIPLAIHSAIPHKELRFIFLTVPFAYILAGAGMVKVEQFIKRKIFVISFLLVSIVVLNCVYMPMVNQDPMISQSQLDALYWVGEQKELDTIVLEKYYSYNDGMFDMFACGTYTFLHQKVPIYYVDNLLQAKDDAKLRRILIHGSNIFVVAHGDEALQHFLRIYGFSVVKVYEDRFIYQKIVPP